MRLTFRLALAVLACVALVLSINVTLRIRREAAVFEADIRRDHMVLGRAVAAEALDAWTSEGPGAAALLVVELDAAREHVTLSLHERSALPPEIGEPLRQRSIVQRVEIEPTSDELFSTYVPLVAGKDLLGAVRVAEPLAPVRAYVRTSLHRTMFFYGVALVLSGAVAWLLGWIFVGRPVAALRDKLRRIGAGDFADPIVLRAEDELSDLAREVNATAELLAQARARASAEAEARIAAIEQLRHADRLATIGKLSAGVAHELGTPLNVAAGRARMIVEAEGSSERARQDARIVVEQAERMTRIVRQLLDFARARKPAPREVDLAPVAQQTVALLRPLAEKRGVRVGCSAVEGGVALVDPDQLQQALTNLVVNAIQASAAGGAVEVSLRCVPDRGGRDAYALDVVDAGTGMDEETMQNLFVPFFTKKDVGEGTGLGLAVSWGLVKENGGDIEVESAPGRGSRFSIVLPAREAA